MTDSTRGDGSPDTPQPQRPPQRPAQRPETDLGPLGRYEVESDAAETEAPRRAASAQFVVEGQANAEVSMRAAMDPANQSLAEALRLSYRLLQVVILVLVVLFLFSGFQNVQEGSTGVRTLFGRIYGAETDRQIGPGFTPFWPYPAGEIVTVPARRSVELAQAFWPQTRAATFEQAVEQASENSQLTPGIDGSLLTADGDLAHLRISAEYAIDDAVYFLEQIEPGQADLLVQRAIQRAAVHTAASMPITDLVDSRDEPVLAIRDRAQKLLTEIASGLTLTDLRLPNRTPVLAVRKEQPRVQSANEESQANVEGARKQAETILNGIAGPAYQRLVARIDAYELALAENDDEAATAALAALTAELEDPRTSGEASMIVSRAKAYQSQIDATIGNDYRRFASLLPAYRDNPSLIIRQLWYEAYGDLFAENLIEIMNVPHALQGLRVLVTSDQNVMQDRRRAQVDRRRQDADAKAMMGGQYILRGSDTVNTGPGRRLNRDAQGGFGRTP